MKQKKLSKKLKVASFAMAVGAGTAVAGYSFHTYMQYHPTGEERQMQLNQVAFSDEDALTGRQKEDQKEESALWEKDDQASDSQGGSGDDRPSYLFEDNLPQDFTVENLQNIATSISGVTANIDGIPGQGTTDLIYDFTGDLSNADIIISGDNRLPDTSFGGNGHGNGSGNGNGNGTSSDSGNGTGTNGNGTGDNRPSNGGGSQEPARPQTPASTAKDPELTKKPPLNADSSSTPVYDYKEGSVAGIADGIVVISQTTSSSYFSSTLYAGQQIDERTLFCMMDTYVIVGSGDQASLYLWTEKDLNQYVRIRSVSFDGGLTWVKDFPTRIPEDVSSIYVKVDYRLSKNSAWIPYDAISYVTGESLPGVELQVADSRLYVLNQPLTGLNQTLDASMILNELDTSLNRGTTLSLYAYLGNYFGGKEERQDQLFPGWTEDGKLVPMIYPVTAGRHILEPADMVDIPDGFQVETRYEWMTADGKVDYAGGTYALLQCLTGVDDEAYSYVGSRAGRQKCLEIPQYIQTVRIENEEVTVDNLVVPSSVLYIDRSSWSNLTVEDAYQVDEDNPIYASESGVLLDKEKTRILGIPCRIEDLVIPSDVQAVEMSVNNRLHSIEFEAESIEDIPKIDFTVLSDCKVIVADSVLMDYVSEYKEDLKSSETAITTSGKTEEAYYVQSGALLGKDGSLYKVLNDEGKVFTLPNQTSSIEKDAFSDAGRVKTLVLPKNADVTLEKNCFSNSHLTNIICSTEEQKDQVLGVLEKSDDTDIRVSLQTKSKDGYTYLSEVIDDVETVTLLEAPEDALTFDGTIETAEGRKKVDIIGDHVFENAGDLQWAILDESVSDIGYRAFYSCQNLQGVYIANHDKITIGNQAFDACDNLRFVASNAREAEMLDGYDPVIRDQYSSDILLDYSCFFVPYGASGYGASANEQAYDELCLQTQSDDGSGLILYGGDLDESGKFVAESVLRAEVDLPEDVQLPATITKISAAAFAGCEQDGFTVNWDDFSLDMLDSAAFYQSGLCGRVTLGQEKENPDEIIMGSYAFRDCEQLEKVVINSSLADIGEGNFWSCHSLKSVEFSEFTWHYMTIGGNSIRSDASLYANSFFDCGQLEKLVFNSASVTPITIPDMYGYQFNTAWSKEEEAEHLRIVVRKDMVDDYLREWKYRFCDFAYVSSNPPYLNIWNWTRSSLMDWDTWEYPADEVVDQSVWEQMLESENFLRSLLGARTVTEPTDLYPYRLDGDGMLKLVGAPSYVHTVSLDWQTLDFPDGWYLDYVGSNAFSGCAELSEIIVPDNLAGFDPGFLNGACANSGTVTIRFSGGNVPTLRLAQTGIPYVFGLADEQISLAVPEAYQNAYLVKWIPAMCGYDSAEQLKESVQQDLAKTNEKVTDEMVRDAMTGKMLVQENRLRAMMGMEQIPEEMTEQSVSAAMLDTLFAGSN